MSASLISRLMRTWPPAAAGRRSPCTWRSVTGSIGLARSRSTMPKGAAANLAIGGASPVATLQREARRVGERPAGVVLQSRRQLDREARVLGQRRGEARARCSSAALSSLSNTGASAAPGGRLQPHLRRQRARHRRGEAQRHRADRQAGRVGALALAAELGREGACAPEVEALLDAASRTFGLACAAMPVPQTRRSARVAGQRALAGEQQRALGALLEPARLQQRVARRAADDAHRQALADAFDLAPGVGRHAGRDRPRRSAAAGSAGLPRSCEPCQGCVDDHRRAAGAEARTRWCR